MVRVRIPPSPTGLFHIGTARTALYNFLFARHHKGVMVYRSEDTDKERSKKEYEENITSGLSTLGIIGDEGLHCGGPHGPYRMSERGEIYQKHLEELIKKDKAYFCFCSKERLEKMREEQTAKKLPTRYDGACSTLNSAKSQERVKKGEPTVIRLRVPADQDVRWNDLVRGEVVIHSRELDDFVIARRLNDPLYNLAVMVDDHVMEITHVIRGEDHISNTPKQILLYQAFGWPIPEFAHLPLILNPDKTKLSKRKNKVSVDDYLAEGFLPEGLINYLALLGWTPPSGKEILSLEEMIAEFSLDKVHKGGAIFDLKRLEWINGEWIKRELERDADNFCRRQASFFPSQDPLVKKILCDPDFAGRFKKLSEIPEALKVFFELPAYEKALLLNDKFKITPDVLKIVLGAVLKALEKLDWQKSDTSQTKTLSEAMTALVTELNLKNGQVLWPLRAALSGTEKSPNFATLMVYLGKTETLRRLELALKK